MGNGLTIGSRGSALALCQSRWVRTEIERRAPHLKVSIEVIRTTGDKVLDTPLSKIGGKGLFVKEIEDALLDGRCDLAVHSLKDVPDRLPPGLVLGAELEREVPFDAFVSNRHGSIGDLPQGARVGTSSLRRRAQLMALRPDIDVVPLRGNVDTRLKRLSEGLDAVILAAAGLRRLGLDDRITELMTPPEFIPAVGQGVVVTECRMGDEKTLDIIRPLSHDLTGIAVRAERAFLYTVGGGCQVPLGAYATVDGDEVEMSGFIADPDGKVVVQDRERGTAQEAGALGASLATRLLNAGGRRILDELDDA